MVLESPMSNGGWKSNGLHQVEGMYIYIYIYMYIRIYIYIYVYIYIYIYNMCIVCWIQVCIFYLRR